MQWLGHKQSEGKQLGYLCLQAYLTVAKPYITAPGL